LWLSQTRIAKILDRVWSENRICLNLQWLPIFAMGPGFVQRLQLDPETPALAAVGNEIAEFVRPLFIAPNSVRAWQPGGPWR